MRLHILRGCLVHARVHGLQAQQKCDRVNKSNQWPRAQTLSTDFPFPSEPPLTFCKV